LNAATVRLDPAKWRRSVAAARTGWAEARRLDPPTTTDRDTVLALMAAAATARPVTAGTTGPDEPDSYQGIGVGGDGVAVAGTVVRADDLVDLLGRRDLPADAILVVPTLEPAWAVAFHRLRGVVTDLGGALSHASILLREARVAAVVNARGVSQGLRDGDRVVLDPERGVVFRQRPDLADDGVSDPAPRFN
jgi:pyruvate,water dikinase